MDIVEDVGVGAKKLITILHNKYQFDIYGIYKKNFALKTAVTPVPSYGVYCYARYQYVICSLSLSLEHIIYKTSLRSALWETIVLKLRWNSVASLYTHQYCADTSNFKSHSRKKVSFYGFMDVPHTIF